MNPTLSLQKHVLAPQRLESLMLKDRPVVPPDSVIRTFGHLKGDKIDLVLTQDSEALCQGSFVVRQGEWGRFFLDSWFDPLYRNYNFQKAEGHALVCPVMPPFLLLGSKRTDSAVLTDCLRAGTCRSMAPHRPD